MSARRREPTSRRERPAKQALTRDGITAAALNVLRTEGLAKVTMRRLAQELDTGPASLYVYVANTAELHAAVLDELLGEVDLTATNTGEDWRDRLVSVLASYTDVLFRHPALARSALTIWPNGEHYLGLLETVLALLDEGGVAPGQAAWGVDALLLVATATAAEQSTRDQSDDAEREWQATSRALHGAATHPHVLATADALQSGSPRERLSWQFRMVINGIASTPIPSTKDTAT